MARSINDSLSLLETTLGDITTSLANKEVVASNLKASQVPNKIREIETYRPEYYYAGYADDFYTGVVDLNEYDLPQGYPLYIVFTDQKAPDNVDVVKWSENEKGKIVKWFDEERTTLYVSSQRKGEKIVLPVDCKKIFTFGNFNNTDTVSIDLSNVDTSRTTSMSRMFSYVENLTTIIGLDKFDTSNVTNMDWMFNCCVALETLDVSNFNIDRVTNTEYMFQRMESLKTIYAPEWANNNIVENSREMFANSTLLPNYSSSKVDISMAKWKENGGCFTNPAEKNG